MSQDNPVTWGRGDRVPPAFASDHDGYAKEKAQIAYEQANAARNCGNVKMCEPKPSELQRIASRLRSQAARTENICDVTGALRGLLFGETTQGQDAACHPRPCRSGALGDIEDVIDRLSEALDRLETDVAKLGTLA